MTTVSGHGVKIRVAQWEGKNAPVFSIHGITANCRCWDVMASKLAPEHRVMAMDLRGRGLSEKPQSGYAVEHHVKDILSVMDHLDLEKTALMGHSLGAFIAAVFGALHPKRVERMILVDGGGKLSETQLAKAVQGTKPSLDRLGRVFPSLEAYLDHMKKIPFYKTWTPALETYFRYDAEEVTGGVRSRVHPDHIQEERENLRNIDISQYYGKINCPVLILRATEGVTARDELLLPPDVVKRMIREIPRARCVDIPGTNHYSIIFDPNEVRDLAVSDFLAKQP